MQKQFTVVVERDEDGFFVAAVPSLPGCHTQAKTLTQLKKNLIEVIELCLDVAKQDSDYRRAIENFSYQPSFVGLETVCV
jgi:predicted RNase H-like HicB family nuclease